MLPYIGGKSLISKTLIVPNIPKDIEVFCEPFSGMMWTFFNMELDKYNELKTVVYNDFNPLNANLFKCISEDPKKLLEYCEKIPVQRKGLYPTPVECKEYFNISQSELYQKGFSITNSPNYEIASKHALILSSVFSGANPEKSKYIDLKGKYHSKFTAFMNKLRSDKWIKMFMSINHVECLDFEEVIKKYDNINSYFYCDPPYYIVGEGNYYSNHDFTREDHQRLKDCLKSIKGKFSLSYYDFPQLSEWFPKDEYWWKEKQFSKAAMAKQGQKQSKSLEILIMNYGL